MKALSIIILLGVFTVGANAQTISKTSNYPYYTLSKEASKLQFKNIQHVPAKVTLVSPAVTQAKGMAQFTSGVKDSKERFVVKGGYPAWTISKAVARRQFVKSRSRN